MLILVSCAEALSVINGVNDTLIEIVVVDVGIWVIDTLEVELDDSILVFVILVIPEDVIVDANDPDACDVIVGVYVGIVVGVTDTDLVLLTLLVTEIVGDSVDVRVFVLLVVGQVDEVDVLLFVVVADCELETVGVLVLVLLDVPVIISVIVLDTVLVYELSVDALAIFVVDTDGEDVILDVILLDPVSDVVIVSV